MATETRTFCDICDAQIHSNEADVLYLSVGEEGEEIDFKISTDMDLCAKCFLSYLKMAIILHEKGDEDGNE